MYKYESALVLARTIGAQWEIVNLEDILVFDIYNKYPRIYLTLSNVFLDAPVFVDFNTLREEYSSYGETLHQLLIELGNRTLETVPELPNASVKYVKYSDAFYSGYKIDTTKIGVATTTGYPAASLVDLKITRPGYNTDMSLIHSHCLISVNGFFHRTDTDGIDAFVFDGRKSLEKSKHNQLGIHSFLDIGNLKQVPITEEHIYAQADDSDLKTRTYIWLDEDLADKTVLLVLGGYLILPDDGVFWQSGDRTFAINFSALPMIERYYESSLYLDLSDLELDLTSLNEEIINVTEFLSDETLKKYLTLSQSFFVIVDTPNLFTNKIQLRNCNMPGMFTAFEDPTYPLIVSYGKVAEYWKTFEDGQWSVTVQDSFQRNYVFTYTPVRELANVTPNNVPSQTFYHSQGYMLQIGAYT